MHSSSCRAFPGFVAALALASAPAGAEAPSRYAFEGTIERPVLEAYLFRSATAMNMLGAEARDDQIRMALHTGLKFAGRAFNAWGAEAYHVGLLSRVAPRVELLHALDPELILQGTVFEIVTTSVNDVAVPGWALEAYGLPPTERHFRYDEMLYPDGRLVDHWSPGASVPDITRLETRLWIYALGRMYVDAGFEAIHVGQIELMGQTDADHAAWAEVLNRLRAYAHEHARRRLLLFDGHVPSHGYTYEGDKLLLDFHSFPLRPVHLPEEPQHAILKVGHLDTLFCRSKGGLTPSGWRCESLPYLVELDNFGTSDHEGQPVGEYFVWGWDEICWFAKQPEDYRNEWLAYAVDFLRTNDPIGFLEMPFARCLASPAEGQTWFYGNTRAPGMPSGFSVEKTIRRLWGQVAFDARDSFLAGDAGTEGFGLAEGIALGDDGSLAAAPGSELTWTAPEAGEYMLIGTLGPAAGARLSLERPDGAVAAEVVSAADGVTPFRVSMPLALGEAARLRFSGNGEAPFMLVVRAE